MSQPWMRQASRGVSVVFATLTFASLTSIAAAQAEDDADLTALMMGGTGMPVARADWMDSLLADYIDPATGTSYTPVGVDYPAGLPVDHTVQLGLTDLHAAMDQLQAADPGQPYLVAGYSLSALIAVELKRELAAAAQAGQPVPDVTVALFGSGNRPDGGIYERLDGLFVPGLQVDANGAEPTDLGIPTLDVANQYDGLADTPQFPVNLVSDLNAVLGVIYRHTSYGDGAIPGWTDPSTPLAGPYADQYVLGSTQIVEQVDGDTTFYFIPTTELPLLEPLRQLGVPEPVLNIVQPALQVIVEAGYDRSVPFGDPTPFQLIPTLDPVTFSAEFAKAVVQGANNAFELFGVPMPGADWLESMLTELQTWSAHEIGVPYYDAATWFNDNFNPFTAVLDLEGPLGLDIQNLLDLTGIQQAIDPVLELIGTLGGLVTG
ncbi:PE-PPE domain-containing protein [Mycobacterium sp. pUA109]|uniref:PE-PPE domain-containing protein n=1 Tax=Mycobacterium sp. pUA109 TaxID=3238982 RepID=UPI00351B75E3